jgi:hypothetical protein
MTVTSAVAGVAILPAAASAAASTAPCVREDLRLPAGSWQTFGPAIADPSGRFQISYGTDTSWHSHLVRWDNGVPTDLGTPPGALEDVNQQGDIAGNTFDDETYRSTAWRLSGGQLTPLPGLPGSVATVAEAIAPDGTVAGWVGSADDQRTAVTWAPDNTVRVLPSSGRSWAIDIDADGDVVGYVDNAPVRWAPGAEAEVLPAYAPGPDASWELAAISAGTVIGTEYHGNNSQILVWAPGAAPVSLGTGAPLAINARGSIVYKRVYENELWLRQDGVDRSLPFGPSPYPIAQIAALTDNDIAYGLHYSNPERWICP